MAGGPPDGDGYDDHAGLLSELKAHDLAFAMSVGEAEDPAAFAFDADADPDGTFPQSVASGGPTSTGVILWTRVAQGERIGVEFVTPAITSLNAAEALHLTRGWRSRVTEPLLTKLVTAMNPHIDFFDSHNWGYSVVEFTREDCTYVGYAVDKTRNEPGDAEVVTAYRVPEGEVELEDVTGEYRESRW